MLHTSTVEPLTLSILKKVMQMPELKNFSLVGGTALSLKYGHRKSIDLDFFSHDKFDVKIIQSALTKEFGKEFEFEQQNITWALFCKIKGTKVDIVYYPHPPITPFEILEGIKMYSNKDIAAMKINAILGRGAKKDFWDIAQLLSEFKLEEIIQFHKLKYPSQMLLISIPTALTYYEDAEESDEPVSLQGQTWEGIKKLIQLRVREFLS